MICESECVFVGSIFSLSVPVNKKWSCRMMLIFERSCYKLKVEISIPSITILPEEASRILKRPNIMELFPLPVRPTMPTLSPGLITRFKFLRTSPSYGLYRNE